MRAARLYGLAILLVAAPAVAEELAGGWVTGTIVPHLKGASLPAGRTAAPVSVGDLGPCEFIGNACVFGASLVNANVPNGGAVVTELPFTEAAERHFVGPNATCTTLAHRAAVEIDSTRNGDLEVLFGLRGGTQLRMYDNPASCNGDDLDVIFRNGAGAANACNPAPGAQISPVQSLNPLNGIALAGNSYHMTVRDTVAPGGSTRFLLAGHATELNCANAEVQTTCPGVSATLNSAMAFADAALGGVAQPHLSGGAPTACLFNGQFAVGVYFEANASFKGEATMVPLTNQSAAAYFVNPQNLEVFIKLVDNCAAGNKVWVFIAGLTNLRIIVTITDMSTGLTRYYINPNNTVFRTIVDQTVAFDC